MIARLRRMKKQEIEGEKSEPVRRRSRIRSNPSFHSSIYRTLFSMEHIAKLQPSFSVRLVRSASINSDLPEFGTPVTMASSPGTTCGVRRLELF